MDTMYKFVCEHCFHEIIVYGNKSPILPTFCSECKRSHTFKKVTDNNNKPELLLE